jgi:transcriptional regulator with XRE-family HTH domain
MNKKTTHTSVSQMVRETTDAPFADAFEARVHRRRIVKDLMVLRAGRGLTQGDIASKMGCSQSRISKLESSTDFDLTLGDLVRYASAVGFRVGVVLEPRDTTVVGRVRNLAFQIKHELDRLAGLASDDQKIARGVAGFFNEAFFNLVRILQGSAKKLPCDPGDGEPPIWFEIHGGEDGGEAVDSAAPPSETKRLPELERSKPKRAAVGGSC